jgi:hypothetical protein
MYSSLAPVLSRRWNLYSVMVSPLSNHVLAICISSSWVVIVGADDWIGFHAATIPYSLLAKSVNGLVIALSGGVPVPWSLIAL